MTIKGRRGEENWRKVKTRKPRLFSFVQETLGLFIHLAKIELSRDAGLGNELVYSPVGRMQVHLFRATFEIINALL
jgi:hypothetical protein